MTTRHLVPSESRRLLAMGVLILAAGLQPVYIVVGLPATR